MVSLPVLVQAQLVVSPALDEVKSHARQALAGHGFKVMKIDDAVQ